MINFRNGGKPLNWRFLKNGFIILGIYFLSHTSWIAFMTTCCTDSSIDMILPMYSSLLAQLTAQPRISWRRRPNSHLLLRSPLYSHKQMSITFNNRKYNYSYIWPHLKIKNDYWNIVCYIEILLFVLMD